MSAFRMLQQGIAAIQADRPEEGARLLRGALREPVIAGSLRATAYMWLAETTRDPQEKITCYTEALSADPTSELAQQRLALLLAPPAPGKELPLSDFTPTSNPLVTPPPPPPLFEPPGVTLTRKPPPTPAAAPRPAAAHGQHIVGVFSDGQRGSGFFMTRRGLIATTRFVVASQLAVTVQLPDGRQLQGQVVRAFPELDVAFVHVEYQGAEPLPASPYALIPDGMPLQALSYSGQVVEGRQRETGRMLAPHWFPTDIVRAPDAGGSPLLDDQRYLVGMLTRNTSSAAAYLFGVHIAAIQRCLEAFSAEMHGDPNRIYCPACGGVSRAAGAGGYYCELCGAVMPHAAADPRLLLPQVAALYRENAAAVCPACFAQVGSYQGRCLRCGSAGARSGPLTSPLA